MLSCEATREDKVFAITFLVSRGNVPVLEGYSEYKGCLVNIGIVISSVTYTTNYSTCNVPSFTKSRTIDHRAPWSNIGFVGEYNSAGSFSVFRSSLRGSQELYLQLGLVVIYYSVYSCVGLHCGSCPGVLNFNAYIERNRTFFVEVIGTGQNIYFYPRSVYSRGTSSSFSKHIFRIVGSPSRMVKSSDNCKQRNNSKNDRSDSRIKHKLSPPGHAFLGFKITVLGILLTLGFYLVLFSYKIADCGFDTFESGRKAHGIFILVLAILIGVSSAFFLPWLIFGSGLSKSFG